MLKESELCDCRGSSRATRRWHTISWKMGIMLLPLKNSLICFMEFILFYLCVSLTREGWRIDNLKCFDVSTVYREVTSSVQLLSRVRCFATPWTAACQAFLSIPNSQSLLKLMSIELGMPSNHLILCRLLFLLPSIFPSIRALSNKSVLHIRWPKHWSFSISISLSNEYSGLIFRMDSLDLFAVQGTLKSLLQHHRSKASILQHLAFFTVQLSHPYYWKSSPDDNESFPLNQKACGSSILTLVSFIHKIRWELWWTPQLTEAFGIDKQMYI